MIKFGIGLVIGILLASNDVVTQSHLEQLVGWIQSKTEQQELPKG